MHSTACPESSLPESSYRAIGPHTRRGNSVDAFTQQFPEYTVTARNGTHRLRLREPDGGGEEEIRNSLAALQFLRFLIEHRPIVAVLLDELLGHILKCCAFSRSSRPLSLRCRKFGAVLRPTFARVVPFGTS